MQWNISLLCCAVWLFWLCFAPVCSSTEKHSKYRHDRPTQIHQKTHSTKKLCSDAVHQKCSPGFYREWDGSFRGQCVPCQCNGLSNECDAYTGNCVNCQFNTYGERCERCKKGYYGNGANRTCHACPCPFTWNNFAQACMAIGSGVIECLCQRGYRGARCERCAYGYFGNPMVHGGSCKPCNCKDGELNICDSLTGECIASGDSADDQCHECDSCTVALLFDLEKMDDALAWLKQQLQNFTSGPGSLSGLNQLQANISQTKILVRRYSTAVSHLVPKVQQLEADVDAVEEEFSQLIDKTLETTSHVQRVLQSVDGTKLKGEDLLSEAEELLRAIQDLIKRLTEWRPGESLSENNKAGMMEEAQHMVQEMRARRCAAQRDKAGSEQQEAHTLFNVIRNMSAPVETSQAVLDQTAASLMASDSSLREVAELLSDAEDKVDRTQGLNLKSHSMLQHLEHLHAQLEREQSTLFTATKDLLKNATDIFLMLKETKDEFESQAAELDGARSELMKRLNKLSQILAKVDIVLKAEEYAEELNRMAAELQQVLHNAANRTDLLSALGVGAFDGIINAIEKAEMAANQSREAADQALKDVKEGALVNRAEGLKDSSTRLWTEANEAQSDLETLSHAVSTDKDRVNGQKEKGESLRKDLSGLSDDIKSIKRDDTKVLIESAKSDASAVNAIVSDVTERLRSISQDVEGISLTNVSLNIDDLLNDTDRTMRDLNRELPVLNDTIMKLEALGGEAPPNANMTESIRRIKDIIEETRTYVNRLSLATTFNGKSHVELHPPRNLEDIKTFTAVDLLLNRHQTNPLRANYRRKRRQDKIKDANSFVFYLGNKNASGDYIGMAIRSNLLICFYKLGGVLHEVETSQITTATDVNPRDFDRVVFHRVYQDAEVNITHNSMTQKHISLAPKHNLSNFLLQLDPDNVVFYVGGYPEDFVPPGELQYPKYRGAMKLSYVNDNPICLFNYKRAVNLDPKQQTVGIGRSDVSYYEGTGYCMVLIKEPNKIKRRLFRFQTNSQETNALLFYIGNEESFFCVFVERGFLMLQGQQTGREIRLQSDETVSPSKQQFAIVINDEVTVHYGGQKISTYHNQTNYMSYYIGGLPALLRQRHNITVPPLRGCVHHLTANNEFVECDRTIGVSEGCPVSLLGIRSAVLNSPLSAESLFALAEQPLRVSLGFRSTDRDGTLLRSSSQGSTSVPDLQLSLADGYLVFTSDNYTLRSDKRYNDGSWHYLSALRGPAGLELSIDNVIVIEGQSAHSRPPDQKRGKFTACITNIYTRRLEQSFVPADLSSVSLKGDVFPGPCSLHPPPHTKLLPRPVPKRSRKHISVQAPAGTQCIHRRGYRGEYQLIEEHSWLSYTVPEQDLNYRPHFALDIKTKSSNGLIFHVAGRGAVPLLALYMANGKIKLSLGHDRIIQHTQRSNDSKWHRVEFSVEKSTFHLLVDGFRVTDGHLPNNEGSSLDLHNPVHLGGDTTGKTTKGHNIPMKSVMGCIREFKMTEEVIGEPEASHKILPCSERLTEIGTYFGGGHIILDNYFTVGSQFVLAFEIRPQYLTGLLFHVRGHKTSLNVFLVENKVGVKVNDGNGAVSVSVTPPESLCDGKFHIVTVSKQLEVIKLEVDGMSEQKAVTSTSTSYSTTLDTLYIGGTTKQNRVSVSSPFVGCLRNVKLNGRPVEFKTGSTVVSPVSIDRCPPH